MRVKFLILLLFFLANNLVAQRYTGFLYSDYAGILGAKSQPASLADSPYKYDISLLNGNYYITNNIAYRDRSEEGTSLFRYRNDKTKFIQTNVSVGGLAAMVSLPGKQGLGISYSARIHGSGNDISPEFIQQFNQFARPEYLGQSVTNQQLDYALSAWHEVAITYATVLKDDGYNKWKLGITPKLVNSVGASFAKLNDLDYEIDDVTAEVEVTDLDVLFGYSDNLNDYEQFDGTDPFTLPKGLGFKFAIDFGVTFERAAFRKDPSEKSGTKLDPDITYEHKISASITDLGRFTFDMGSASTHGTALLPNLGLIDVNNKFGSVQSFRELADSLATIATTEQLTGEFTVTLPTALNLNYDYNIGNYYYINANAIVDMTRFIPADYRINHLSNFTVTPRWEKGLRGLYTPIHFNQIGDVHLGLAARMGPLTIGTQSIGSLISSKPRSGNFFFSINISKLKANSKKPYCFGTGGGGSASTTKVRTPLYKRKKWIFF